LGVTVRALPQAQCSPPRLPSWSVHFQWEMNHHTGSFFDGFTTKSPPHLPFVTLIKQALGWSSVSGYSLRWASMTYELELAR
jgi:hypothetical protein